LKLVIITILFGLLFLAEGQVLQYSISKRYGLKILFLTWTAEGYSFWPGCRPTGALFRNYRLCPWCSTIGKFLGEK
jgi:hypothetical protein